MFNFLKKNDSYEEKLYSKILYLSRNKFFYSELSIDDTFQNRIYLIFLHTAFIFLKVKQNVDSDIYKKFYQNTFDLIFKRIELDMREIGFGDVTINKNMKFLVTNFFNILINCEKYSSKNQKDKNFFFNSYLKQKKHIKSDINIKLIEYFDKYHSFCLDLTADKVLKGELNFTYK